ncbi:MAG: glycosyltransferase family 39 protein [Anaerolineae bacterium]|jgi:4-amino-4-deoxy-L-arabinose transferase-like glycosyltransferase|nr:glycosyltransferase family 39 protein [Anaerolineae bacterium]
MQHEQDVSVELTAGRANVSKQAGAILRSTITILAVVVVLFLALYNLTDYPVTWFDEGSHLHVPKTLVRFGVYADYSSEGFRYYGPTVGVGPTVMLPIAAVFKLFGIGLLQARLVIVLYLLAAIYVFYRLALVLGDHRLAWVATALLITSRGVSLIEYGRQVLGEVPGLFFTVAGLGLWLATWEKASWRRLGLVGLLLGLAMVTKNQYLLVLVPTLGLAWLANLVYYRTAPHRIFIVPGLISVACFALWQIYMILYLGPATASENLTMLREQTAGAALVFSPELMKDSLKYLVNLDVYLGMQPPVLVYGLIISLPRQREGQRWGTLFILIVVNLVWYVVASIGWPRYAFPGLAIASLFVAHFFSRLTEGFQVGSAALWQALQRRQSDLQKHALRWAMLAWLAIMITRPLLYIVQQVVSPPPNTPAAMAAYLDKYVPREALIETFEPEMGFLTDHNYHFAPTITLQQAVRHVWLGGPPLAESYDFVQKEHPDYVLVGPFAHWINLYPADSLAAHYRLVTSVEASWPLGYELYIADE